MKIHNDENQPVRMHSVTTSSRVEYYGDIISYLVRNEINRCKSKEDFDPSPDQIAFFEKELIRLIVIRRDIDAGNNLKI